MTDGFGRLMARNEQLVRANVRLTRKLGRKCYWLNGVEAKLGMSVRDFLEVKEARQPPHVDSRVDQALHDARKERDEARAEVSAIHRREDGLRVKLDEAVSQRDEARAEVELLRQRPFTAEMQEAQRQRDEALARHKQAHDRAMVLHVVIDRAVEQLRKTEDVVRHDDGATRRIVEDAIRLLTREDLAVAAKTDVDVLRDNAIYWEAEAKERAQSQTDLENRMDEAAKLIGSAPVLTQRERQALALLVRVDDPNIVDEGGES